jgi:hypothetical protein
MTPFWHSHLAFSVSLDSKWSLMAALGHERRFRDVCDESGLPPTPERLRQRSELTLRAKLVVSSI